jgi:hypothetical protein
MLVIGRLISLNPAQPVPIITFNLTPFAMFAKITLLTSL